MTEFSPARMEYPEPDGKPSLELVTNTGIQPQGPAPNAAALEIRQIAGLTAGTVMPLNSGVFHFRHNDNQVRFSLVVESKTRVIVNPGTGFLRINNEEIAGPTHLGNGVLDVGSERYIVRPYGSGRRLVGDELLQKEIPVVSVPDFGDHIPTDYPSKAVQAPSIAPAQKSRFGLGNLSTGRWANTDQQSASPSANNQQKSRKSGMFGDLRSGRWAAEEDTQALDGQAWEFVEEIRDVRIELAERYRAIHPHPEEILYRLRHNRQSLWNRDLSNSLHGRVSVAYADLAWAPLFDIPERIPAHVRPHIARLSNLPSVPITANLPIGPLGIIGYRPSALAVARQVMLALATTTQVGTFEIGLFVNDEYVQDWEWVNSLPQEFFTPTETSQAFVFTDGRIGYERASDVHPVSRREVNLIILAETLDGLPPDCATVVEVDQVGACRVANHLSEVIDCTPLGVTGEFATNLSEQIVQNLG